MSKKGNTLPFWGNENTMNLNSLVLTNIQSSPYFKNGLIKLKTYHEVIDEIYYKVDHLEPWERGSRQTAGQVGMCGGVRGVGCGGIVSSAYCLLFKLYTLKLTRKQVNGLLTHTDSPFIRGLGFMYIRYTAPPSDLFDWFEPYLNDEEEIDPKAGTGAPMTIGEMLRCFLTKQDWFSTLFPRIPVPVMKEIENRMPPRNVPQLETNQEGYDNTEDDCEDRGRRGRNQYSRTSPDIRRPKSSERTHSRSRDIRKGDSYAKGRSRSRERRRSRSPIKRRSRSPIRRRSRSPIRRRSRSPIRRPRSRSRERVRRSRSHDKHRRRSRSRERKRSPHRSQNDSHGKSDFSDALQREKARQEKEHSKKNRSRSRSKDRNEESKKKEKNRRNRSNSRERRKHKKSKKHKRDRSRSKSVDIKRSSSQDR